MAENSKIEWCDATFNPWVGCQKVSPGCTHCYAETLMTRKPAWANTWGPRGIRRKTSEANWKKPLAWNRKAEQEGRRYKVFCGSLCDVFEDKWEVDPWRADLFEFVIEETPNLDWLLLTKRPENVSDMVPAHWRTVGKWPANVWIGTSVENQKYADERIPYLLRIPVRIRFLSIEPLLGPVDLTYALGGSAVAWVIVGGESGPNARRMHPDWARTIRDQCLEAGVPFLFKQWGGRRHDSGGRLLDGREWNQYPVVEHAR